MILDVACRYFLCLLNKTGSDSNMIVGSQIIRLWNEWGRKYLEGKNRAVVSQEEIECLRTRLSEQQEAADNLRKEIRDTIRELARAEISAVVPSEVAINASRNMGPLDDIFFNKMGEDTGAIGEVITTVLDIPVIVREVIPQYTITGIGNRGVRLDAMASVLPEVMVSVELGEDCYLGDKGALINIEVQKEDKDDHE